MFQFRRLRVQHANHGLNTLPSLIWPDKIYLTSICIAFNTMGDIPIRYSQCPMAQVMAKTSFSQGEYHFSTSHNTLDLYATGLYPSPKPCNSMALSPWLVVASYKIKGLYFLGYAKAGAVDNACSNLKNTDSPTPSQSFPFFNN